MANENWPGDLVPAGRNDVWPVDPHCPAMHDGHYCTLVPGHRGDHLTLIDRWERPEWEEKLGPGWTQGGDLVAPDNWPLLLEELDATPGSDFVLTDRRRGKD